MPTERLTVALPSGQEVSAVRHAPEGTARWTFVYAPGAGSNLDDPFGVFICGLLATRGAAGVRFQFPYQQHGRRAPDRPQILEATWRAVVAAVRPSRGKLCIGGRSMGGRVGSMVAAQGVACDAVALFAYPLHPPGKPEQRRDEHLPSVSCRTLFVSGTSDAFASAEELREAAALIAGSEVHLLEGADHGFAVRKSTGRTRDDVYAEAGEALLRFLKI